MFHGGRERANSFKIDNSTTIHYIERGRGEPVIFIPGFTFSHEVFEKQLSAFSEKHRVIVVDPRSHGKSTMTREGNNYPEHGRDLHALFEMLDVKSATLVGWSFGALSAWSYVEQFGLQRIARFACIDMPPVPISGMENNGAWVEGPIEELAAGYHAILTPDGQKAFMSAYAEHVMVQRKLKKSELDWITSLSLQTPTYAVKDLFASGLFSNYFKTAKRIDSSIPNIYFLAEHWAEVAKPYVNKEFPNAKTEVLGGHMMFWEYASRFNERLLAFMDQS